MVLRRVAEVTCCCSPVNGYHRQRVLTRHDAVAHKRSEPGQLSNQQLGLPSPVNLASRCLELVQVSLRGVVLRHIKHTQSCLGK